MAFLITSCAGRERSRIEVIKIDSELVKEIIAASDQPIVDTTRRKDFYYVEHYLRKSDSTISRILKDSLGRIVGINQARRRITIFAAEYYPNGQLIGKITIDKTGNYTGPATYYYKDGRIRSTGNLKDMAPVGIWKKYDSAGYPMTP